MASEDAGQSPATIDSETLQLAARTLNIGLAVVSTDSWEVLFENANFFAWFPPESDADEPLTARLPSMNAGRELVERDWMLFGSRVKTRCTHLAHRQLDLIAGRRDEPTRADRRRDPAYPGCRRGPGRG